MADAATNLHNNLDKVRYTSFYPSDVVAVSGTTVIANPGYDCVAQNDSQGNNLVTSSIANPYGKRCLVRYVWSIDGSNFNSAEDYLLLTFFLTVPGPSTETLYNMKAAVEVRCDASNITFITANGDHGDATINNLGNYTAGSPIAHTFTIKYALIALDE